MHRNPEIFQPYSRGAVCVNTNVNKCLNQLDQSYEEFTASE